MSIQDNLISVEITFRPIGQNKYKYESKLNKIYQCSYFDRSIV